MGKKKRKNLKSGQKGEIFRGKSQPKGKEPGRKDWNSGKGQRGATGRCLTRESSHPKKKKKRKEGGTTNEGSNKTERWSPRKKKTPVDKREDTKTWKRQHSHVTIKRRGNSTLVQEGNRGEVLTLETGRKGGCKG